LDGAQAEKPLRILCADGKRCAAELVFQIVIQKNGGDSCIYFPEKQ
jgi:hypothetical protein